MRMQPSPENWGTECVVCGEVITNPICIDCLEREVIGYLMPENPVFLTLVKGVSEFFRNSEEERKTTCILCGSRMNVCSHCYKNEIYELLLESSIEMAEDFKEGFFDCDMAFTKEAG